MVVLTKAFKGLDFKHLVNADVAGLLKTIVWAKKVTKWNFYLSLEYYGSLVSLIQMYRRWAIRT